MGSSRQNSDNTQNRSVEDIDAVARSEGTTRAKASRERDHERHKHGVSGDDGLRSASSGQEYDELQSDARGRQNGYRETQGTGYGEGQNTSGVSSETTEAQSGYDPTHSGVRHAHNRPGTRPPVPGRETGTAWGEDQQMGTTTDTPDRKNPAE